MAFRISELVQRDIVNLSDGAKLGAVKDVQIDLETGQVLALVLGSGERKYFGLMNAGRDVVVPWENIRKFGVHTVLVEVDTQSRVYF
ncbi:PRC-barrel domain protein [Pelotomaculum sp. FP]|uniref:YlmC/YmxH family sporulation protein n=1 Tax=Pelotomaculum sp. FP TaxID=261474 RepID=UPI001065FAFD|nr:YlmC/YmxH family sporulation protein [Pelotomaculum sp. FP]TEB17706.1 PRC-barrel domain protein [Pelotomaculum sp. FP]